MSLSAITLLSFSLAAAANGLDSLGYENDPYLEYRPAFARSLPVQILLTGVVFTLVAVLFIHLMFTAQSHWPLAPVNYVLQMSGVTTLLISLIATLHVVLAATLEESRTWPYMLSYIAVNVPPLDGGTTVGWSTAERATWLIMNATTSGLIQITHIQFLTLLYPSKLEGRLVFSLLGPLAVLAAVMQLVPISGSYQVNMIASAIRNVCNATLSLLFTVALFVWGILVNREQAWRTDGGTAAFGAAALALAVVSTALNFLYIPREEEYVWLPGLMWAVVLWQSFLGWWWWVGSGSGIGLHNFDEPDAVARRRERRREKRKHRNSPHGTRERAQTVWRGVAGAFGSSHSDEGDSTVHRRSLRRQRSRSPSPNTASAQTPESGSISSITSSGTLPRILPATVHRWYASLRQAHLTAARKQAMERVERIRELERAGIPDSTQNGWGLGSFAWRVTPVRQHRQTPSPPTERSEDEQQVQRQNEEKAPSPSHPAKPQQPPMAEERHSIFWWGPLSRWRLQDSTRY